MKLIEIVKVLHDLNRKSSGFKLDSGESIVFQFRNRDKVEKEIMPKSFDYEKVGKNEISINLFQYQGLFYDKEQFLQHCDLDTFNSDIAIFFYRNKDYLYYNALDKITQIAEDIAETDYFIQNTFYYLKFYHDFNSSEIISYHSSSSREFVIISPEKGKFLLGYPAIPPLIANDFILENNYNCFNDRNQSQEFQVFFREQIIESLSAYSKELRFPQLLYNIKSILEASERNYEIFLNKFSFEKLKENFRKERNEYFSAIRDIVNQLLNKIVSIPISISASVFAVYKLKDEPRYSWIVVVAFIIYSLFTSYLLRLLNLDIGEIKIDFDKDIDTIKKSSNIPEATVNTESSKVYKKINRLNTTIGILQIILAMLSMLILVVSFQIIDLPYKYYVISLISVVLFHLFTSFFKVKV